MSSQAMPEQEKISAGGDLKWGPASLMRPAEGRARRTVRVIAAMPPPERMRRQSSRPSDPVDSSKTSRVIRLRDKSGPMRAHVKLTGSRSGPVDSIVLQSSRTPSCTGLTRPPALATRDIENPAVWPGFPSQAVRISSSSGSSTTLSCSFGSVRAITAVQGSVRLVLYGRCGMLAGI
jgi:hypothetical protein